MQISLAVPRTKDDAIWFTSDFALASHTFQKRSQDRLLGVFKVWAYGYTNSVVFSAFEFVGVNSNI